MSFQRQREPAFIRVMLPTPVVLLPNCSLSVVVLETCAVNWTSTGVPSDVPVNVPTGVWLVLAAPLASIWVTALAPAALCVEALPQPLIVPAATVKRNSPSTELIDADIWSRHWMA